MQRRFFVPGAVAVAVAACGGQTAPAGGGPTGGADAGGADNASPWTPRSIAVVKAKNGLCLPERLALDAAGDPTCEIVEALSTSGDACGDHPGLVSASASTATAVRGAWSLDAATPVCVLSQVGHGDWVDGSCAASTIAGWCYLTGTAAGPSCQQAIAFSTSGSPSAGAEVGLACP